MKMEAITRNHGSHAGIGENESGRMGFYYVSREDGALTFVDLSSGSTVTLSRESTSDILDSEADFLSSMAVDGEQQLTGTGFYYAGDGSGRLTFVDLSSSAAVTLTEEQTIKLLKAESEFLEALCTDKEDRRNQNGFYYENDGDASLTFGDLVQGMTVKLTEAQARRISRMEADLIEAIDGAF